MARKNVLLFLADQWRGDTLGVLGHRVVATPNLDAFAAEATTFRWSYANATPCAPSRASMLTSQYLMNHRVVWNGTPLEQRHTNLALEMRKLGYEPAMFGYTSSTPDPRQMSANDPGLREAHGNMIGFVDIAPGLPTARAYMSHAQRLGYALPADPHDFWLPDPEEAARAAGAGRGPTWAPARFPAEHSDNAFFIDEAMRYIGAMGERPWFAHVATMRPHPPFIAPRPYHDLHDPADVPPPVRGTVAEEAAQHPLLAALLAAIAQKDYFRTGTGLAADLEEGAVRQLRATYYGMMAELDHHFGRLIRFLKDSGQYDDTLIIFSSDHGEMLGNHRLLGKSGYFDDAFRIPLIVRAPAGSQGHGRIVDDLVEAVDLMPTILDWLGAAAPVQCQGASLLPFCRGATPTTWRDAVFYEFDFRHVPGAPGRLRQRQSLAAVRDGQFKYVHFPDLPPLLFDLVDDPHETIDRSDDPAMRMVVSECRARLLDWRMGCADPGLAHLQATADGLQERRDPPRFG